MKKTEKKSPARVETGLLEGVLGQTSDTTAQQTSKVIQVNASNIDSVINLIR